jgi:hypothetical protein
VRTARLLIELWNGRRHCALAWHRHTEAASRRQTHILPGSDRTPFRPASGELPAKLANFEAAGGFCPTGVPSGHCGAFFYSRARRHMGFFDEHYVPDSEPEPEPGRPQNDTSGQCAFCGVASDDVLLGVCADCA